MKIARLRKPGGLSAVEIADAPEPGAPGPGEILVRVRAASLNYHDLLVVLGRIPTEDGRILLSDGAGEVVAVGPGVGEFSEGDAVISTFYPRWPDGPPASLTICSA